MANIKKQNLTLNDLFKKNPTVKDKLDKILKVNRELLITLQTRALYLSFLVRDINDTLKSKGYDEWLVSMIMEYCKISQRTTYNYFHLSSACIKTCECLRGMTAAEIITEFEKKNTTIGENIISELQEKFPNFSLRDFYPAQLPEPRNSKSKYGEEARKSDAMSCRAQVIYTEVLCIAESFINTPKEEQAWRRLTNPELAEMCNKFELSRAMIDEVLTERERLVNGR